jgi:hypothetical protein
MSISGSAQTAMVKSDAPEIGLKARTTTSTTVTSLMYGTTASPMATVLPTTPPTILLMKPMMVLMSARWSNGATGEPHAQTSLRNGLHALMTHASGPALMRRSTVPQPGLLETASRTSVLATRWLALAVTRATSSGVLTLVTTTPPMMVLMMDLMSAR